MRVQMTIDVSNPVELVELMRAMATMNLPDRDTDLARLIHFEEAAPYKEAPAEMRKASEQIAFPAEAAPACVDETPVYVTAVTVSAVEAEKAAADELAKKRSEAAKKAAATRAAAKPATLEEVRLAAKAVVEKGHNDQLAQMLKDSFGVDRISKVPEDRRGECLTLLKGL